MPKRCGPLAMFLVLLVGPECRHFLFQLGHGRVGPQAWMLRVKFVEAGLMEVGAMLEF